jgi:hypothetical protein
MVEGMMLMAQAVTVIDINSILAMLLGRSRLSALERRPQLFI